MSLFYGYKEDDIDLKNVPDAVDGGDAISKQVLENYRTKYRDKSKYYTVFEININRAVTNNGIVYHIGSNQIERIKDGGYYLHQNNGVSGPTLGNIASDHFISSETAGTPLHVYDFQLSN